MSTYDVKNNLEGPCDCICKKSCHPMRQSLQCDLRIKTNKTIEESCCFYKHLIEHYKK